MKKFLHLSVLLLFFLSSFAQTKEQLYATEQLSYASQILYTKISYMDQTKFMQQTFAELAYLKRTYKLDSFKLDDKKYISKLNDYYYKTFFPYSKLLDENALVTEDCFSDSTNAKIHDVKKTLFYTLYPKQIKMPKNIVDQIEEDATLDEFLGPYNSLNTIYFLKKYNYENLTAVQKKKLASVEKFLSDFVYKKYVENNPKWSFYKFLSIKVLMMNDYKPANPIDITGVVAYVISDKDHGLALSAEEKSDIPLMNKIGYKQALEYEFNAVLWIFLLELNKN